MNTKTISEPKIRKRINHDSMWIECHFPSGAHFKYIVRRYGTQLEFAFSNDDDERMTQMETFKKWIKDNTTTYGELFERLETICLGCNTGKELINKMK